jgi:oligopeptide/dipeptide ABC transporter ATP-binding protein
MSEGALLELRDVRVAFDQGGRRVVAVDGLSYSIAAGRTLALIGESGSGKTVSSRAVVGLLPPSAKVTGSIRFEGQELVGLSERRIRRHRGASVAMVFQDPARSLNPTMRIGAQVTEAIRAHQKVDRGAARTRAVELLKLVRLPAAEQRFLEYPHQLSGGMRQRVAIAIALAANPRLLIADEATTALDVTTQAQILDLLSTLQQRLGMAMLFIAHDLGVVARIARRVAVMYAGRKVEEAAVADLLAHPRHPYTQGLLASLPDPEHDLDGKPGRLKEIPGLVPPLHDLPPGCAFAPRCPLACDACRSAPIELRAVDARSVACIRVELTA